MVSSASSSSQQVEAPPSLSENDLKNIYIYLGSAGKETAEKIQRALARHSLGLAAYFQYVVVSDRPHFVVPNSSEKSKKHIEQILAEEGYERCQPEVLDERKFEQICIRLKPSTSLFPRYKQYWNTSKQPPHEHIVLALFNRSLGLPYCSPQLEIPAFSKFDSSVFEQQKGKAMASAAEEMANRLHKKSFGLSYNPDLQNFSILGSCGKLEEIQEFCRNNKFRGDDPRWSEWHIAKALKQIDSQGNCLVTLESDDRWNTMGGMWEDFL